MAKSPSLEDTSDKLEDILGQKKTTSLMVTHDVDESVYLSDRVIVMSRDHGNNGQSPGKCGASLSLAFRHEKRTFQVAVREKKKEKKHILGACANQRCRRQAL